MALIVYTFYLQILFYSIEQNDQYFQGLLSQELKEFTVLGEGKKKEFTVLAKDPNSVYSTHRAAYNHINLHFQIQHPLMACKDNACGAHTYMYTIFIYT